MPAFFDEDVHSRLGPAQQLASLGRADIRGDAANHGRRRDLPHGRAGCYDALVIAAVDDDRGT